MRLKIFMITVLFCSGRTQNLLEKTSELLNVSVSLATNNYFKNHMKRQSWENIIKIDSAKGSQRKKSVTTWGGCG